MYGLDNQLRESYQSVEQVTVVAQAVNQMIGADVELASHSEQGLTTQVFTCETPESSYIVRRGNNVLAFQKDALAAKHFGETVPIPKVVGITALSDGSFICVSERAEGMVADESCLYDADSPLSASLLSTLTAMHEAEVPQTAELAATFTPIKRHSAAVAYAKSEGERAIDARELQEITFIQERLGAHTRPGMRKLCHNDIKGLNLLTENQRITGVIDWAMAELGDPACDLGAIYAAHPDALKYVQYRAKRIHERILFYAMSSCVGSIRFFSGLGRPEEVTVAEQRLLQLANEAETSLAA